MIKLNQLGNFNIITPIKKTVKVKTKSKSDFANDLLYREMFTELKKIDPDTKQEVVFSHFMPTNRKFRADFLCPGLKMIIEINGGQYNSGRHTRGGKGYETDLTKLNLAQMNGYKIIQFTYQMLQRGEHLTLLNSYK
jgi:very-short-patch-repair endonuclease